MKTLWIVLMVVVLARAASASDPPPRVPSMGAPSYRCLFVIDTSLSMEQQGKVIPEIVGRLILGGLDGRLHDGDLIGIWTFGNDATTAAFPAATWTRSNSRRLAARVFEFLNGLRYWGRARMDRILEEMFDAVRASEAITVVILSDGADPIVGTPFDRNINTAFEESRRELKQAGFPFATILTGSQGRIHSWAIHSGGTHFEILDLPEPRSATSRESHPPTEAAAQPLVSPGPSTAEERRTSGSAADQSNPPPPDASPARPPDPAQVTSTPPAEAAPPTPIPLAPETPMLPSKPAPASVPPVAVEPGTGPTADSKTTPSHVTLLPRSPKTLDGPTSGGTETSRAVELALRPAKASETSPPRETTSEPPAEGFESPPTGAQPARPPDREPDTVQPVSDLSPGPVAPMRVPPSDPNPSRRLGFPTVLALAGGSGLAVFGIVLLWLRSNRAPRASVISRSLDYRDR